MAETLTITDNRTGKTYELPIQNGTVRAMDLRQIKVVAGRLRDDDLRSGVHEHRRLPERDHLYRRRASGILMYRGYPIEQLAEHSDYLETAYLVLFGELPSAGELGTWVADINRHTLLHENVKQFLQGFRYDAHPMGMFLSIVGAMSTFYPDAKNIFDARSRRLQTIRLIATVPSIAAYAYRHSRGLPYVVPDSELSFTGNFLNMLFKMTEPQLQAAPGARARARRALHPARRPRAELQHPRDARHRQLARRPVLGARRRGGGALRPAPRRRQRGGAADARRRSARSSTSRRSSSGSRRARGG